MGGLKKGKLVVISGPSGVGKGTLVAAISDRVPDVFYSISATTRFPRADEIDGVHYYFLTTDAFEHAIKNGDFLEWANIYGDMYGTLTEPTEKALKAGKLVILEIDVQGAAQVQNRVGGEAAYIFIEPPSLSELKRRLETRKTESTERIADRLKAAENELEFADRYDYVIINDDLDRAVCGLAETLLNIALKED